MDWLDGHTGTSFFDVWSIVHFSFWIVVGSVLWSSEYKKKQELRPPQAYRVEHFAFALGLSYIWELVERPLENSFPQYWLSPESWWNSWVSDPLMCVVGLLFIWYIMDHWRKP